MWEFAGSAADVRLLPANTVNRLGGQRAMFILDESINMKIILTFLRELYEKCVYTNVRLNTRPADSPA